MASQYDQNALQVQPNQPQRPRRNPTPIPTVGSLPQAPAAIPTTGGTITTGGAGGLQKAGPGSVITTTAADRAAPDPNPTAMGGAPMAPPPPPPVDPGIAGVGVTPYGPGNDLRGGIIAPVVSGRAGSASGMVDTAAQAIGSGPNRSQIAQDRLAAFDTAAQPHIRDQIRSVGQRAAALGRVGMGDTGIEATRPFTDYLTQRAALSHSLAADTAEGEISDRRNNFNALSGYESDVRGFERGERDEVRGERDFQSDMARDALENAFRERQLESGEFSDEYNRALQEYLLELGVDPTAAFLGASNQYGQSAATSVGGASGILGDILARQGR